MDENFTYRVWLSWETWEFKLLTDVVNDERLRYSVFSLYSVPRLIFNDYLWNCRMWKCYQETIEIS